MITIAGSFEPYKTTWNIAHAVAAHAHSSTETCSRNASPASALLPPEASLFLEFFPLRRRARRTGCAIAIEDVDQNARRPSLTRTRGSRDEPARPSRFPASGRSARHRRSLTAPKGAYSPPPPPRMNFDEHAGGSDDTNRYLSGGFDPSEPSFLESRDRLGRNQRKDDSHDPALHFPRTPPLMNQFD